MVTLSQCLSSFQSSLNTFWVLHHLRCLSLSRPIKSVFTAWIAWKDRIWSRSTDKGFWWSICHLFELLGVIGLLLLLMFAQTVLPTLGIVSPPQVRYPVIPGAQIPYDWLSKKPHRFRAIGLNPVQLSSFTPKYAHIQHPMFIKNSYTEFCSSPPTGLESPHLGQQRFVVKPDPNVD